MSNRPSSNREKILQCAKELFYDMGYQTTSVDNILEQCSVAKSNFYYHFKTKEQLGFAVLEQQVAEYESLMVRSLQNEALTPPERFRQFFESICQLQSEAARMGGCPFGNFAASLPNTQQEPWQERFRERLGAFFHRIEDAISECVRAGIERGDFRADIAPAQMASFLMGTTQGLLILTKTYRDVEPLLQGVAIAQKLLQTH